MGKAPKKVNIYKVFKPPPNVFKKFAKTKPALDTNSKEIRAKSKDVKHKKKAPPHPLSVQFSGQLQHPPEALCLLSNTAARCNQQYP
jgi:hypothetical protein